MQNPALTKIQTVGNVMVDVFHNLALFVIGATIVWSAVYEYLGIMKDGYAGLKDILLLFIYLELGAIGMTSFVGWAWFLCPPTRLMFLHVVGTNSVPTKMTEYGNLPALRFCERCQHVISQ